MNDVARSDRLLQEIELYATQLVRQAGQMALGRFRQPLKVEYKQEGREDPVTETDRGIEAFLRTAILREYPEHAILGEEGTEVEAAGREFLWVLDPLDGTTNYVNGLPIFACSAALLHWGEPVVGAIFLPVIPRQACYMTTPRVGFPGPSLGLAGGVLHARLGGGAFLDDDLVRAADEPEPEASSLSGVPGHHARQFRRLDRLRRSPGELRCLGSVCFETAMVAAGVFRYSVFRHPKLWDVAAGTLIVREAGGVAFKWTGDRWEPLTRFDPARNPKEPGEVGLRFWGGVTLVGGSRVGRYVSERLRPVEPARRPKRGHRSLQER